MDLHQLFHIEIQSTIKLNSSVFIHQVRTSFFLLLLLYLDLSLFYKISICCCSSCCILFFVAGCVLLLRWFLFLEFWIFLGCSKFDASEMLMFLLVKFLGYLIWGVYLVFKIKLIKSSNFCLRSKVYTVLSLGYILNILIYSFCVTCLHCHLEFVCFCYFIRPGFPYVYVVLFVGWCACVNLYLKNSGKFLI